MVDQLKTGTFWASFNTGQIFKINIIDGQVIMACLALIFINQIQYGAANAANGRQSQFHRPGFHRHWLGTLCNQMVIGRPCILYTKRHAARARPMFTRKKPSRRARLIIGNQIDAALPPEINLLAAM